MGEVVGGVVGEVVGEVVEVGAAGKVHVTCLTS